MTSKSKTMKTRGRSYGKPTRRYLGPRQEDKDPKGEKLLDTLELLQRKTR